MDSKTANTVLEKLDDIHRMGVENLAKMDAILAEARKAIAILDRMNERVSRW